MYCIYANYWGWSSVMAGVPCQAASLCEPLFTRLIETLGLPARECGTYNRGMDELTRKEVWSDDDDVLLKAWMAIYENPLTPPLTFQVINAAGESVSVC